MIQMCMAQKERIDGRCLYPFLHARVSFSGKMYFCPFIRVEVGDLAQAVGVAVHRALERRAAHRGPAAGHAHRDLEAGAEGLVAYQETYDRDMTNIFAIQSDIARQVVLVAFPESEGMVELP